MAENVNVETSVTEEPVAEQTGFCRPPKSGQFKPGQSGNAKGRPKGSRNTYKILDELLSEKVLTTQGGKQIKLDKKTILLLKAVNASCQGDFKALSLLFPHLLIVDEQKANHAAKVKALSKTDNDILEAYIASVQKQAPSENATNMANILGGKYEYQEQNKE